MRERYAMSENFGKLREIFLDAVERYTPEQWPAYLDEACAGDDELHRNAEMLLKAHAEGGASLDADPVSATQAHEPLIDVPGTVIGPYKLLEQIGEGGFGIVFMAEQQRPIRRKVALKVVKPGMDTRQVIARFEAERQALALMDHPNIAKVLDAGQTTSGRPYFVMDLVKGIPITDYCDQSQVPVRERLELFMHVCQAVQHAHQKGIIHRDIKPSNVMVTLHDGTPLVKIIDFGIAKALGQQLTDKTLFTGFAQLIGSPLYMAPEQAALSNADVDTRSDIYSLGVLLYELMTGTTPFDKERFKEAGYDEIRRIIREEEPPRPSTRLSTLRLAGTSVSTVRHSDPKRLTQLFKGELDWIVMKCLEKDRNRRYETAGGLARDVERYLHDEPVQACPPSAGYRLRKFVRRNKGPVLAVSLVLLALVVGIIGTTLGLVQALANAEKARAAALAEEKAKQAEADQRLRAEANLRKARQAVDDYFTLVSESALLNQPALEPLRKQLLQAARRYYEDFVREHGDDPEVQAELVAACLRISNLIYVLGLEEDWLTPLQNGVAAMEDLMRKKPDVSALHGLQAGILRPLAVNPPMPRPDEARRTAERACVLWQELVRAHPRIPGFQNDLAVFHIVIGIAHLHSHRHAEAVISYRKAYDLVRQLVLANPRVQYYQAALVLALGGQTFDLAQLGRVSELKQVEREALEIAKKLMADFPDVPAYRELTAWLYGLLSESWRSTDHPAEALEACRQHLAAYEKLARDFPEVARYKRQVAWACEPLGQVLWYSGRHEEAVEKFRQVSSVLANLDQADPQLQDYLAWFLANCPAPQVRNVPQAIKLAKETVKARPDQAQFWLTLGAAQYRAGDWTAAVEALTKSIELGREGGNRWFFLANDDGNCWFFLAMAHWQVGNQTEACRSYERGVKWMDTNEPYHVERRHLRSEAEKLLAIKKSEPRKL
jgi:serine/threonine protein kinase/tetratricopeptide (TPR) repeat protein